MTLTFENSRNQMDAVIANSEVNKTEVPKISIGASMEKGRLNSIKSINATKHINLFIEYTLSEFKTNYDTKDEYETGELEYIKVTHQDLLAQIAGSIEVAIENGVQSITVSGFDTHDVQYLIDLDPENITPNYAGHSKEDHYTYQPTIKIRVNPETYDAVIEALTLLK